MHRRMALNDRSTVALLYRVPSRQSLPDVWLASLPLASPHLSRLWRPDTGKGRLASQCWVNMN